MLMRSVQLTQVKERCTKRPLSDHLEVRISNAIEEGEHLQATPWAVRISPDTA
jgi:hypothetical protein